MYIDTYFEWDEKKNQENIRKHQISFGEARKAFADPKRIILQDSKHSGSESRMYCLVRVANTIIMVRYVKRGKRMRIFGAGAWRQAKLIYERKNNI